MEEKRGRLKSVLTHRPQKIHAFVTAQQDGYLTGARPNRK